MSCKCKHIYAQQLWLEQQDKLPQFWGFSRLSSDVRPVCTPGKSQKLPCAARNWNGHQCTIQEEVVCVTVFHMAQKMPSEYCWSSRASWVTNGVSLV